MGQTLDQLPLVKRLPAIAQAIAALAGHRAALDKEEASLKESQQQAEAELASLPQEEQAAIKQAATIESLTPEGEKVAKAEAKEEAAAFPETPKKGKG